MLEVTAWLDRNEAIYLAGEMLKLFIKIRNISTYGKGNEELAWGSVQFTSERMLGQSKVHRDRPATSMTRSAATVYSSPPSILFCELSLCPGEAKEFSCDISLSKDSVPPTYRGYQIKYTNQVTIAVSHVQSHIKFLNLPIRIVPSIGLEKKISLPANPFLGTASTMPSVIETVMATVDDLTLSRRFQAFSLSHSASRVALLTLPKKAYKLGEDVYAHLDFSECKTKCVQYSVAIETVERILESNNDGETESKKKSTKVHAQTAPVCAFTDESTCRLTIPLTSVPTFTTDSVQHKWFLNFKFVVSESFKALDDECLAPIDVKVESFSWSTEILVLPCKPQNIALLDHSFSNKIVMNV